MLGYFKQALDRESRAELLAHIGDYAGGRVPLVVPLTLFAHHIRRCGVLYLADQVYLRPHPVELMAEPRVTAMKKVVVTDRMQRGDAYWRTEPVGRHFAPGFTLDLTPKQMLKLGVFGGKYMTDCHREFLRSWFAGTRLCAERHDALLNCFGVNASQSLAVWRRSGCSTRPSPFFSKASARQTIVDAGLSDVSVTYVGDWHDHARFIEANDQRVRTVLDTLPTPLRPTALVWCSFRWRYAASSGRTRCPGRSRNGSRPRLRCT